MSTTVDPRYPTGKFTFNPAVTPESRREAIATIAALPERMRQATADLDDRAVDTPYRDGGWTIRQVVHHVADSHLNAYVRFKLALTETHPRIKAYDEGAWANLADSREPIEVSLKLLDAVHRRWGVVLAAMSADDFARTLDHPESGAQPLDRMLQMYAWHSNHHLAHVGLARERAGR